MTTDELRRAYRIWRSIQDTESLLADYREYDDGRLVWASLGFEGDSTDRYATTFPELMVRQIIVEAQLQHLGIYYAELESLGVTPSG